MEQDEKGAGRTKLMMVKSSTPTKKLAGSIVSSVVKEKYKTLFIRAVGAGAIAQMVYAVIIATNMLENEGAKVKYKHYYKDIDNLNFPAKSKNKFITAIEYKFEAV